MRESGNDDLVAGSLQSRPKYTGKDVCSASTDDIGEPYFHTQLKENRLRTAHHRWRLRHSQAAFKAAL